MPKSNFLLFLLLCQISCGHEKSSGDKSLPKVKVETVLEKKLPITIPAVGHIRAYNSAVIKAQVEGLLQDVHFEQGQRVSEGDLLFTIDQTPYQAKVEQANAILIEDIARLNYAADKVDRYKGLLKQEYVSSLEFEEYLEQKIALEAQVMRDQADLNLARTSLDHCSIKSPFSGVISKKYIDKGNLITNDGKTMAIVKQIDPVYVDFSIPEGHLLKVQHMQKKNPLTIYLSPDNQEKKVQGKVIMIDNAVNENTGMITLRALLNNTNLIFWPGQFISVHLLVQVKQKALVVPQSAININEKGSYVFVIRDEGLADLQFVKTGFAEKENIEILSGLKKGQKIVVEGQINIMPKSRVQVINE